jgi:thioredoxin reductase (NADPH)
MDSTQVENVIVIGGGVAGLSAAMYNARANLNPLVFAGSPPGGQLTLTTEVENFPGTDSIMGPELVNKIREQAKKFGTRIMDRNIVKVDFSKKPFEVYISETDGSLVAYKSKTVVIATGAKALWLNLPSEERLRGKGVSACATCDGFFFRNKVVAIVGGGDTAMEEALTLTNFASKVYVIHRRDSFRASQIMQDRVKSHPKIEIIWNSGVEEVLGENKVEGVRLAMNDGSKKDLELNGLFIAIGHKPDTEVFKDSIELDKKGYIITSLRASYEYAKIHHKDNEQLCKLEKYDNIDAFNLNMQSMTSVPGVFAAGDCVDTVYRQAATAAGLGVAAALEAERWLELAK